MIKRLISISLLFVMIMSLCSCKEDVSFTCMDLTLTFPHGYHEEDAGEGANMLITNGESTVTIKRLSVIDAEENGISGSYSAKQFANFFLINSGIEGTIASSGDVPYYSYYEGSGMSRLFCVAAFYRTPYAYFIVIFATDESRETEARAEFFEIMSTSVYNIPD